MWAKSWQKYYYHWSQSWILLNPKTNKAQKNVAKSQEWNVKGTKWVTGVSVVWKKCVRTFSLDRFLNHSACMFWHCIQVSFQKQSKLIRSTEYLSKHLPACVFLRNFTQFNHLASATSWQFLSWRFFSRSIFKASSAISLLLWAANLFHFLSQTSNTAHH